MELNKDNKDIEKIKEMEGKLKEIEEKNMRGRGLEAKQNMWWREKNVQNCFSIWKKREGKLKR